MAPCSPSSSSQARAAGPPTWRSLTEQLDQASQWTLACLCLLVPDARGETEQLDQASQWTLACLRLLAPDAGGRKRLRAALLLRCREVGATAYVPEVIWMPVSPSLSVPAGKGGDWCLGSVSLLLFAVPHLLSELTRGSLTRGPRLVTAGGCWPGPGGGCPAL